MAFIRLYDPMLCEGQDSQCRSSQLHLQQSVWCSVLSKLSEKRCLQVVIVMEINLAEMYETHVAVLFRCRIFILTESGLHSYGYYFTIVQLDTGICGTAPCG